MQDTNEGLALHWRTRFRVWVTSNTRDVWFVPGSLDPHCRDVVTFEQKAESDEKQFLHSVGLVCKLGTALKKKVGQDDPGTLAG